MELWGTMILSNSQESIYIYIETSVRNKCRCSFYCALLTLHVSVPVGGNKMHNPIIKIIVRSWMYNTNFVLGNQELAVQHKFRTW
jgi:hypothetical protein